MSDTSKNPQQPSGNEPRISRGKQAWFLVLILLLAAGFAASIAWEVSR